MSKRIIAAAVAAGFAAVFAPAAEAKGVHEEHGIVVSHYGQDRAANVSRRSAAKTAYRGTRTRAQRVASSMRSVASHAHGGGGGGEASRACLQPQARALLDRIESQFGRVTLVSTCRPGAVIAGSGRPSKHRYGLAVDFDAGSRKSQIVQWLIANHSSGGTMTYAHMGHVHVDVGPRFVALNSRQRG